MSKLRVLVFEEHIEKVLRELSRTGEVELIDYRKDLSEFKGVEPTLEMERIERINGLLHPVNEIISRLSVDEGDGVGKPYGGGLDTAEKKIVSLKERVEEVLTGRREIVDEINDLSSRKSAVQAVVDFGVSSGWLSGTQNIFAVSGVVSEEDVSELTELVEEKTEGSALVLTEEPLSPAEVPIILVTLREHKGEVNHLLENVKFVRYYLPDVKVSPKDELKDIDSRIESLNAKKAAVEERISRLREKEGLTLLSMRVFLESEKMILSAVNLLGKTKTVGILESWAPKKNVGYLIKHLEKITDGEVHVEVTDPKPGEQVPVMLDNPSFIKPFEVITKSYGLPAYCEIDPTIFLAVSFPLIFGMMFGDVGHGAVIALVGFIVSRLKKADASLRDFGRIFTYCGITSTFFGFLYGSIFGLEHILHPIWMSPVHDLREGLVMELIGLALFVGFVQMLLGILINSVNRVYSMGLGKTVLGSLGRFSLFCGVTMVVTKYFGFPIPLLTELTGVSDNLLIFAGFVLPISFISLEEVVHSLHKSKSPQNIINALGAGIFESLDSIAMFLSNLISYSRIIILALIHAMLSEVVFVLADLVEIIPFIGFILYYGTVFAGTFVLILGLEGLVVYVHTLRLHFYEWFNKFYGGRGTAYKPFKITPKYIY